MVCANSIIQYNVQGLQGAALTNANTALTNAKTTLLNSTDSPSAEQIERLSTQGKNLIQTSIQPYGYFTATITSSRKQTKKGWLLTYLVDAGSIVKISNVNIRIIGPGASNPIFLQWQKNFPIKKGDPFNSEKYNTEKQSFFSVANNHGFTKAKIKTRKVDIKLENYSANITLVYATGKQYFFGPVSFSSTDLKTSFLKKYFDIKPGEPYSTILLLKSQQYLANSGYFSDVSMKPIHHKKETTIPIHIELKQLKKMLYTVGAGYGTDTGPRGQLGWDWRLLNAQGHHLQTQFDVSSIGNSLGATYYIPGSDPRNEQYSLGANIANYKTDAGESGLKAFLLSYAKKINYWQWSFGLTFQSEQYQLTDEDEQISRITMPSLTLAYLFTDNPLRPNYGTKIMLNVKGSSTEALSDVSFQQYQASYHQLFSINDNNRLNARLNIGVTNSNDFDKIPLSLRFTAGGAKSIRGYGFQNLGPGKYLAVTSLEYQYRVTGNWYAAYFNDAGNAFDNMQQPDFKHTQGVGVVWQSPIGTMELSYGEDVSTPNINAVQFSMGGFL